MELKNKKAILKKNRYLLAFIWLIGISACTKNEIPTLEYPSFERLHKDNAPIDILDGNSGKLFDILTSKTTGLDFNNKMDFSFEFWEYTNRFNGGGLAIEDLNNDGLPDIYFCSNLGADKLFLNKGDLKFEDITTSSKISKKKGAWSTGVNIIDINADGWLDIYVCHSWNVDKPELRKNDFYINQGDGTFINKAEEMGVADDGFSAHASFFDYDNDGDLDLYVLNHPIDFNDRTKFNNHEKIEAGINLSDHLYRNNGDMTFTNVSVQAGINNHGFGLSVNTCDFNQDGWQDLLVTNDWGMQDQYYINQKNGTFKDESLTAFPKQSFSSMGTDISDFNNDGHWDIFMTELEFDDQFLHKAFNHDTPSIIQLRNMYMSNYHHQYMRNSLHVGNGDGTFYECARASGVASTDWSWGTFFIDADNDGWKDLFVANGYLMRFGRDQAPIIQKIKEKIRRKEITSLDEYTDQVKKISFDSPNKFFRNNRDLTFSDSTFDWGIHYSTFSYGSSFADLDLDGDLDMVTNNMNESAFLYRNNSTDKYPQNNYLKLELKGNGKNPNAIGAEIEIKIKDNIQKQQITSTRGYQSASEFTVHFGVGKETTIDELKIKWADGKIENFKNIPTNQILVIVENEDNKKKYVPNDSKKEKIFSLQENESLFQHQENDFDDFYRSQLKPRFHSKIGPSISVGDIDNDGEDDFYISGATGQKGSFYKNNNGNFIPISTLESDKKTEELGTLLFDLENDGDLDLYIVSGNKEEDGIQDQIYLNDGKGNFKKGNNILPEIINSGSCVTAVDFDQDGDLDLFIGGRYKNNYYPEAGKSYLLENDNGIFKDITDTHAKGLSDIGMVTAALWTDYNDDDKIDLIVVGEWMPIQLFKNTGNTLVLEKENPISSSSFGWWNSIVAGDFDKDGDTDYILGNQGLNIRYQAKENEPIEIYYGDFDKEEGTDFILSYSFHGKKYPIHFLNDLAKEYAFVGDRFKSYNHYARSTTEEVLGKERFGKAKKLEAKTFAHTYMENTENGFQLKKLSQETQISNIHGMLVGDFNHDDNLDVLIHGNSFDWLPQYEKQDAISGILLKGNGEGGFSVGNYMETGFESKEEGRALAQLNTDNKSFILTGICDGKMKIFSHNKNNDSQIKLKNNEYKAIISYKNGKKEKKEFYYGEGYLSQSSRYIVFNKKMIRQITIFSYTGEKREIIYD